MRITQKYTDRTYLRYNNKLLENYTNSMEKIWRQKAFKRASEDSINASKAMIVRRNLRDLDTYDRNLNSANDLFKAAESNLYTLAGDIYNNVMVKIEQGCNGTYDDTVDRQAIATEIEQYAESSINMLNKDFAERTMFGGTNNSEPPFAKITDETTGQTLITYNGVIINDMTTNEKYLERISKDDYDKAKASTDPNIQASVKREVNDDRFAKSYENDADLTAAGAQTAREKYLDLLASDPEAALLGKAVTSDSSAAEYNRYVNDIDPTAEAPKMDIYVGNEQTGQYQHISKVYDDATGTVTTTTTDITKDDFQNAAEKNTSNIVFSIDRNGNYKKNEPVYQERTFRYYNTEERDVPGTKPIFVDIGIGIKYDENYEVDPQTAMDVSLNGADITGFGISKDGGVTYSKNFMQQIFDAADAFRRGDVPFDNATLDRFNDARTGVLVEITTLGSKQNSIDFYLEKNDDYRYSLKERQNSVEGCDMEEEITNMEAVNAAYQAILKMSANVLPQSIFDFVR